MKYRSLPSKPSLHIQTALQNTRIIKSEHRSQTFLTNSFLKFQKYTYYISHAYIFLEDPFTYRGDWAGN